MYRQADDDTVQDSSVAPMQLPAECGECCEDSFADSQATTAVNSPQPSRGSTPAPSIYEAKGRSDDSASDVEKGHGCGKSGKHSFATYVVPVLEQGVKSALTAPARRRTKIQLWCTLYRQLFTFVLVLNLVALVLAATGHFPYAERHTLAITLGNIFAATAVRNEIFLRVLFWVLVKLFAKWTPVWFRVFLTSFLQSLGGIHSGSAVSGLIWIIYTVVRLFQHHILNHIHAAVLAWGIITAIIFGVTTVAAFPHIRERHHNVFERHHRYAAWGSILCVWIFVLLKDGLNTTTGAFHESGYNLVHAQEFWYAIGITVMILAPWFTVRKVPVEVSIPSSTVALVKFEGGIQQGLFGRISRSPTMEYHGFGIISEGADSAHHYMIIGARGDWTRGIVNDPPTHLYTRQLKLIGLPYLAHLYRRGVCLCTGSGIGGVLSTCVQLDNWFLIWIGADIERTFGPVLLDMIARRVPPERRILFDTKKEGRRPDTVKMLKDVYERWQAEVVVITSNPKGNAELMQACKENNMRSFGPLWDS